MAMQGEALPLINHFDLKQIAIHKPSIVYANNDRSLILSLNGFDKKNGVDNIGTQAATLNAYNIINNYNPDIIINCGTAGGFKAKGAQIGDVYIASEKVCFHDRRIPLPGGYTPYAQGNYAVMPSTQLAERFHLKQGIISTSDALDFNDTDLVYMQTNNASVKEMEAAAIAWVCEMYATPFTAIKAITDIVDGEHATGDEFLRNFELASLALKEKVVQVIDFLNAVNQ